VFVSKTISPVVVNVFPLKVVFNISNEFPTNVGNSQTTEIIFNNNGIFDGISDFTISNIQGDGTGTVNIGTAIIADATITTADINGGTVDGITSLTAAGNLDIGNHGFRASSLTADGLTSGRVVFAGSNGLLSGDSNFTFGDVAANILEAPIIELDSDPGDPSSGKVRLGEDGDKLEVRTNFGNVLIGPQNAHFSHFYTDRAKYYFDTSIVIDPFLTGTDHLGYTITTHKSSGDTNTDAYDFIITTAASDYEGSTTGAKMKLKSDTASNSDNAVEIKGNFSVLASADAGQLGIIRAASDIIAFASSDKRLKDNIKTISNPISKILQIGGYTFNWNEKQDTYKGQDVGVIAQEIEKVLPEIVEERENGYKAVKYEKIVPLLIEAIKDQQKQIDELKNKLDGITYL
jgi:hypothetical protein